MMRRSFKTILVVTQQALARAKKGKCNFAGIVTGLCLLFLTFNFTITTIIEFSPAIPTLHIFSVVRSTGSIKNLDCTTISSQR